MTEKRFALMSDDEVIIDNNSIADDGGKQTYWVVEYVQRMELVDLLNALDTENKQLQKDLDASIEQISKLHLRISELAAALENKSKEHHENDFKLHTLEKYYTCPNCAFNNREFKYLKSLRRD